MVYLDEFDIWVESWRQTKMKDPIQPSSQEENDISLDQCPSNYIGRESMASLHIYQNLPSKFGAFFYNGKENLSGSGLLLGGAAMIQVLVQSELLSMFYVKISSP